MCFDEFRSGLGWREQWPAPRQHIIAFIANLSIVGKAPSTIGTYVSSIAYVHKINGWTDPCDNFIIKKLIEGSKRQGKRADTRRPISLSILRNLSQILQGICHSTFETYLFRAAFLLAFFGFMRVGEITAPSKYSFSPHTLTLDNIKLGHDTQEFLEVTIKSSKTDQHGESVTLHFIKGNDDIVCPIKALRQYLSVRPSCGDPLFLHFDSSPLTRYQFDSMLKKGIKTMGLNPIHFTPHSFRIGAATSAAISGIPIDTIKSMGRWQSSAVMLYVRPHRLLPL